VLRNDRTQTQKILALIEKMDYDFAQIVQTANQKETSIKAMSQCRKCCPNFILINSLKPSLTALSPLSTSFVETQQQTTFESGQHAPRHFPHIH